MNELFLFNQLRARYPANEYALVPQVGDATGFATRRHADALALSLWPSRGLYLHGFEIKCDRRDWLRELETPEKAEPIAQYCNYWWVVASGPKVAPADELPENWGLLVYDKERAALTEIKKAKLRDDARQPTWAFVAALLRQAQGIVAPEADVERARQEGRALGLEDGKKATSWELEDLRRLRDKVAEFEKASGASIRAPWQGGKVLGAAFRAALEGSVLREREQLLDTARRILESYGEPEPPPKKSKR